MMGIKIKNGWCILLFLSVSFFSQQSDVIRKKDVNNTTYQFSWIQSSKNGRFITFQKEYDDNSDTLVLVDASKPNRIIFQTANIYPGTMSYTPKGYLFMSGKGEARLLKLPAIDSIVWDKIQQAFFVKKYNMIAILQDGKLILYDEEGKRLEEKESITGIQLKNERLFFTSKVNGQFVFSEWKPLESLSLWTSDYPKPVVNYCDDSGLILHSNQQPLEIVFINSEKKIVGSLEQKIPFPITQLSDVSQIEKGIYLIRVISKLKNDVSAGPDIWYANDQQLENKFLNGAALKFLVWIPTKNQVIELNDKNFSRYFSINNDQYIMAISPMGSENYTKSNNAFLVSRYNVFTQDQSQIGVVGTEAVVDKQGNFLLSKMKENWVLTNINTLEQTILKYENLGKAFFEERGKYILFESKDTIVRYDIIKGIFLNTKVQEGFKTQLCNVFSYPIGKEVRITQNYYKADDSILVKILNDDTGEQALGIYRRGKFYLTGKISSDNISVMQLINNRDILYVKSNYNLPPRLLIKKNDQIKSIFQSNSSDTKIKSVKMEVLEYTNSKGLKIKGLLYYPTNIDIQKKYPVIVGIYERLSHRRNYYLRKGLNGIIEGMNERQYLDNDFFVFLPDIVYDDRGPGISALDCVESALDALKGNSLINESKIGLIGHSLGGYETNFIAAHSDRFAAYVSGAASSDIIRSYFSFNYHYFRPYFWKFEDHQYRMNKPFAEDKNLYLNNNPVYYAEKVKSPILLWTGTEDKNVDWQQTMEFYLALKRNDKKAIALFYKNEDHTIENKNNRYDLFSRISEWFDFYLKGISVKWIDCM